MKLALLSAFSLSNWFAAVSRELVSCFQQMSITQLGIVSACAVAFGFLCLKGMPLDR